MALPLYLILGNILFNVVSGLTTTPTTYTSDYISIVSGLTTTPTTYTSDYISTSPGHHGHVITDTHTTELDETTPILHSHVTSVSAAPTHLDQEVTASFTDFMKLKNDVTSATATAAQNGQVILQGVTSASDELSKPTIKCQRVNSSWVEIICFSVVVNPPITYNVFWNYKIYDTKTQQGAMPEKILIPLTSGSKVELSCEAQKGSVTKYSDPLRICEDEANNKEPEKPPEEHGTRHLINISRLITSWGRKTETYIILAVCVPIIIFTLCVFIFVTLCCYKEKHAKYHV